MNKKVAFMTLLCLCFVGVNAQSLYKIGEVTKGKKASYYCSSVYKDVIIKIRNTRVKDTTDETYFKNGRALSIFEREALSETPLFKISDVAKAFKSMLTAAELDSIATAVNNKKSFTLIIDYSVGADGKAKEIRSLTFQANDPVMIHMGPDRLYRFEQKLLSILKIVPPDIMPELKELKTNVSIGYRNDIVSS